MNIIAPTLLGRRRSWQPSSTAHPATIYYHSKLTQLLPHANQFAGAASFTSSAPFFLSLETQLSNQVDKFFPVSEMRAQPSRASCLPRTKTDRRNLCEPRRYERRLPISEYHDLTLSRFSRYVASRGAREERLGAAGSVCPNLPASLPVPARFGDKHAKPDRSPLFCRYLTVCLAGGAAANIAGNQCGDGGGGPVRISGPAIGRAPAGPAGPVLSQCPECENGLEVGVGGAEPASRRPIPFLQHL